MRVDTKIENGRIYQSRSYDVDYSTMTDIIEYLLKEDISEGEIIFEDCVNNKHIDILGFNCKFRFNDCKALTLFGILSESSYDNGFYMEYTLHINYKERFTELTRINSIDSIIN